MHSLGIVAVRGPKVSAYNAILERIHSTLIVRERNFCGGQGQMYIHKIFSDSKLIGKSVKVLKWHENMAIYLLRNEDIIECKGEIECQENDVVVAFCTIDSEKEMEHWIHNM